ncbi:MAG: IS4 family transposase [Syntrophobacteraceae bacterium]
MPRTFYPNNRKYTARSLDELFKPIKKALATSPALLARGNRPFQMDFEQQLRALIYFHLDEHTSGRHLIQALNEDDFARNHIAPPAGIQKSSFFEAINNRGLEQLAHVYQQLQEQASNLLPTKHTELGDLVSIDGSFIQAVLSMHWADYRDTTKKAKVHVGFDINRAIPSKIFLTDGKEGERPFVEMILSPGQTGVMDRGYQCHKSFDRWQAEGKHFVCRIKANTKKACIHSNPAMANSIVFYDAVVLLGTPDVNQTNKELRVVGYRVDNVDYWVATDRHDLSAEQIALVYKLRWEIEKFFAWWKRHLKVYHLIARTQYGLMVQILSGLITYLLLAIYCHNHYQERVSINRVRELQIKIQNELRDSQQNDTVNSVFTEQSLGSAHAKT